jgi:DnaJ-class molecular chaperone
MSTRTRLRTDCPVCGRITSVSRGGRIFPHKFNDARCNGSGLLTGPSVQESITCPTCKGHGVIRPGMVRP